MMGHKQSLRTMKAAHWKLISLVRREKYAEAREQLKKIVGVSMQLTSDLHALELRSNVDKYFKESRLLGAPAETKRPSRAKAKRPSKAKRPEADSATTATNKPKRRSPLTTREQEIIAGLTKQGRSVREISAVTKRSPSSVWDYQQRLKETERTARAERAWLTPEERAKFWIEKLGIAPPWPISTPSPQVASS
jgi:hypothetical protein